MSRIYDDNLLYSCITRFRVFSVYAWGVPAVFVAVCLVLNFGTKLPFSCWCCCVLDCRPPSHCVLLRNSRSRSDHRQHSAVCSHRRRSQTSHVNCQHGATIGATTTQCIRHLHTFDVTDGFHVAVRFLGEHRRFKFLVVSVHSVQHLPGSVYLFIFHAEADSPETLARTVLYNAEQENIRDIHFTDSHFIRILQHSSVMLY